jgi:hypothetical protein
MLEKVETCPECNSKLATGWIGKRGQIRWYNKARKMIALFDQGESLLKYAFWNAGFGNQEAKRCLQCGLVLFRSEPMKRKSFLVRASGVVLFFLGVFLVILLIPDFFSRVLPPRPPVPELVKTMKNISATDGFRYFSGYYDILNNLAAIYAHGHSSTGDKLTIVGPGAEQEFPIRQFDRALSAYRELLQKRGYHVR